jgi:hypothetical protein
MMTRETRRQAAKEAYPWHCESMMTRETRRQAAKEAYP